MFRLVLLFGLPFVLFVGRETAGRVEEAPAPTTPRDVTAETLRDPRALAALEKTGEILFADDFESSESVKNYFEIRGIDDGTAQLVFGGGLAHSGRGAIRLTAPAVEVGPSGSGATGWLGASGYERVYFRRYIRFQDDYDQGNHHHVGGMLAGVAGDNKWAEMGRSGVRPTGADRFTCAFEPWRDWGRNASPGVMIFYTYWVDMKRDADGTWWGNILAPVEERRKVLPRGKWVCLEQMIRVNTIGKADGELAGWIDGELYLHMSGFRWRTSENVRVKRFDLSIYVHEARRTNTVWYDDVVLSTGYIGP